MLRSIEPWLPPGRQGRVMKWLVVLAIWHLCLLVVVVGGVVLLVLFAAGVL